MTSSSAIIPPSTVTAQKNVPTEFTFDTFVEALESLADLATNPEKASFADLNAYEHVDLATVLMDNGRGGSFPSQSVGWFVSDSHPAHRVPSPGMSLLQKQQYNIHEIVLVGQLGHGSKLTSLGKTMLPADKVLSMKEAMKIRGAITIGKPSGGNQTLSHVWQDTCRNLNQQQSRFLAFYNTLEGAGEVRADSGFIMPGETKFVDYKLQLQLPTTYTRPIGNLTALPTIPESPRKHKRKAVELDNEQEEDPASSDSPTVQRSNNIEDRIRFAKALEPNPIPGVTTYDPTLLQDFRPSDFEHSDDVVLKQLPITDIDDTLVRPWEVANVLVPGALVSVTVTLVVWVIKNRAMYHLQVQKLKVHHRPGQPLSGTVMKPDPHSDSQPSGSTSEAVTSELPSKAVKVLKAADGLRVVKKSDKGKGIAGKGTAGKGAEEA